MPTFNSRLEFANWLQYLTFRGCQLLLIVLFVALALTYSLQTPLIRGGDQRAHFEFIRFIAETGRLPTSPAEQETAGYKADNPPLFHLLVGLAAQGIDLDSPPFIRKSDNDPRLNLVYDLSQAGPGQVLDTQDPYQGEVLLWYLGRWVTIGFGLLGGVALYGLLRTVYPDSPWLALAGATLLVANPTYLDTSSVISYEPLVGGILTLYMWILFMLVNDLERLWLYLAAGLTLGLATVTRYTPWPALPLLPLLIGWLAYRRHWSAYSFLIRLGLIALGLAITLGSWILYMELYFNQVIELGWLGLFSPFLTGDGSDTTSQHLMALLREGSPGQLGSRPYTLLGWVWELFSNVWGHAWGRWLFAGVWIVTLIGLVRQWSRSDQSQRLWIVLLGLHLGAFTFLLFLRFLWGEQTLPPLARHFVFPSAAILILLLSLGLRAWLRPAYLAGLFFLIAGAYLWTPIQVAFTLERPALPIQTVPLPQEQTLARFADKIALLKYQTTVTPYSVAIELTWRGESLIPEDYQIELVLFDAADQPRARWLGQPLSGRYPTRAWRPGDRVLDEIHVPRVGLPVGEYRLQLQVLSRTEPLQPEIIDASAANLSLSQPTALSLAPVNLPKPTVPPANHLLQIGDRTVGITLWQNGVPAFELPSYQERSAIILSTTEPVDDVVRLSLIGPDDQPRLPVVHLGQLYVFHVRPQFASGSYRLRLEEMIGDTIIAQVESQPLLIIQTQPRQFEADPIARPLRANFANRIALLGYDLPRVRLSVGDSLPVVLYWQALKPSEENFIMTVRLIDANGRAWTGRDRLPREVYSTLLWASDEIVSDAFTLPLDPAIPSGLYHLLVGFYFTVGEQAVSLPLVQDGQPLDATSINIGPVKIGDTPPGLILDTARPQVELNQPFGQAPHLTLLGYDLTDDTGQPMSNEKMTNEKMTNEKMTNETTTNDQLPITNLHLTLYWRTETHLPTDYTTFVHLRNEAGEVVAQKDQPPLAGAYPTSLWEPGEIIADEVRLPLPQPLPAGAYEVVIGLYDFQTGFRLRIPEQPEDSLPLQTVEVSP